MTHDHTVRRAERTVLGVTPFGMPDAGLAAAVSAAGGLGVLDLGTDRRAARAGVRRVAESGAPFGVRVDASAPAPAELAGHAGPELVLVACGCALDAWRGLAPVLLAEAADLDGARDAVRAGAHGLVLCGSEAAGGAGDLGTFALLQQVLTAGLGVPVWVRGGLGPHTAAGAVAGGATGVVLDAQLALLDEADTPARLRALLTRPSGVQTVVDEQRGRLLDPSRPGAAGDERDRVPAPIDAAVTATAFAARYGTVGAAVRAVRHAIDTAPAGDIEGGLDPSRALPVAQGPMTRVSDQPEFANAVAEHGGMPFVAVALSDGRTTERLMRGTAEALGDKPWGAGILAFVEEELHDAQLAAVRAARPSAVLLAGGRASQATALEADGIAAYLHAPSPMLLRQFLAAGARRFVFEGSECGGHLGPWQSFPLWEAQLGVIEDHLAEHPDAELEVYLAGGVHDARSAAVVSAATAALAARGVRAGVLLGTAYLFTTEAVEHGAIREQFQRQALAATRTAVVETAPGHRTRCLDTPFVTAFSERAAELAELPARERWAKLEEFNTGRLRVASKGIKRTGAILLDVGDTEQLATGMYMAGVVAVLRSEITDIATLHAEVTTGAAGHLAARDVPAGPAHTAPAEQPLDIAVIGMACAFPDAPDLDAFRVLTLAGTDAVTEVPKERFDADLYHGDGGMTSRWGAFLPAIGFDPLSFGIPPSSLGAIDPAQLLSLEIARRALADAGYAERAFDRERTGVIFGAEAGGDLLDAYAMRGLLPAYLADAPAELLDQLPELTEDSFPGTLSNVISGRIANRLDLGGINYTVDAACGSSLAAVAAACRELASGGTDLMLCGAVDLHNGINDYLLFSSVGALSPTGRCRPFDSTADGIALGEGVACVALKRLADAERDGDTIHAVIRGVGAASDGRSLGLTAPRPEGQRRALERAYRQAGVDPADVGMVEAHGTGTVVGDGTELRTLTEFFTERGAAPGECVLGSVKSQIGHTKCAAGMAGMIRAVLALTHGVLPPNLHLSDPNPSWDAQRSPFAFSTTARPWSVPRRDRIAGVSAFGFGGTNFHAVLTAGPAATAGRHTVRRWPVELLLVRGADDAAAGRTATQLLGLAEHGDAADLAHTAALLAAATPAPVRWAIVGRDTAELTAALRAALAGGEHPALLRGDGRDAGAVAFLFAGQGSQRVGMLGELFLNWPELRDSLELAGDNAGVVYPAAAFTDEGRAAADDALRDTRNAQPALGMVETALLRWLGHLGVEADLLAGHSYGELVALAAAGALDTAELGDLSARRASAILGATGEDPGTMAAVRADADTVTGALRAAGLAETVVAANHNSPIQTVISGPTADVERAMAALRAGSLAVTRIPVACAFHSPLLAGAGDVFDADLAAATLDAPRLPVYANRTAAPYPGTADGVRGELAAQLGAPVRWADTVRALHRDGARTFVEIGPGKVLTRLVDDVLGDEPHVAVATGERTGLPGLLHAVARLAVAGVTVDPGWLFRGRQCRDLRTSAAPSAPPWVIDGRGVRRIDGGPVVHGLVQPTRITGGIVSHMPADNRQQLVADYLAANREMIAAQRDVLLGFLGAQPAGPIVPSLPSAPAANGMSVLPALPAAAPVQAVAHTPVESATAVAPAEPVSPVAPEPAGPVDVAGTVLAVIGERTGYPPEMIDDDLDLEADLSIDSIKRTEIAGLLVERIGLRGKLSDDEQDRLSRLRSTGTITAWLRERLGDNGSPAEAAAPAPATASAPASTSGASTVDIPEVREPANVAQSTVEPSTRVPSGPPRRQLIEQRPLPDWPGGFLSGRPVAVTAADGDPDGVAAAVRDLLRAEGTGIDGPVGSRLHLDLTPLSAADESVVPDVAMRLRAELTAGCPAALITARRTPSGALPAHAAGLRGLLRAVAAEYPQADVRLLELAPEQDAAPGVLSELRLDAAGAVIVRHGADGTRSTTEPRHATEPAGPGPGIPSDAVLLVLGGARGITAQAAIAMAAPGRRIELAGRAPHPEETTANDPGGDAAGLRRGFATAGVPLPQVEPKVRAVLAAREIDATMTAVRATGAEVTYHQLDVRDGAAVNHLVKELHARHGRLDGVLLAAGVISDRLLADADESSWRAVFGTKSEGAAAVFDALDQHELRPGFVVQFGSVAAVLGNRGQTDYAAANDAMADLGTAWAHRTGGRVLTAHWGPWAPSETHPGMVSEELARDYQRRGVGLIDPAAGVAALLAEIERGEPEVREVLFTADPVVDGS